MATLDARYTINGLLDTSRPVFENMETITNSCATWLSYDNLIGQWAVVINAPTAASASFNDNNIIGGINLTTTSLDGYYNECEVRFHNIELRDQEDYVLLSIPEAERYPNEPVNRLIINAPMVNNQIQAQLIGLIELKQSRLDKVIEFKTDFSKLNLDAGDVIEITNDVYGWTAQKFRVLQTSEAEQDGTLVISITAQIYDVNVYDDSDLYEYLRESETGLIELDPLVDVSPVTTATDVLDSNGNSMLGLIGANGLLYLIKALMEDGATSNGSVFSQVFDLLYSETGTDIRNGPTLVGASVGTVTSIAAPSSSNSDYKPMGSPTFVAPFDGTYKIDVIFDQNTSGAMGGRGSFWTETLDDVRMLAQLSGPSGYIWGEGSGGPGAQYWTDYLISGIVTLQGGVTYTLDFSTVNFVESIPGLGCNVTIGWNVYSVG